MSLYHSIRSQRSFNGFLAAVLTRILWSTGNERKQNKSTPHTNCEITWDMSANKGLVSSEPSQNHTEALCSQTALKITVTLIPIPNKCSVIFIEETINTQKYIKTHTHAICFIFCWGLVPFKSHFWRQTLGSGSPPPYYRHWVGGGTKQMWCSFLSTW